MMPAAKHFDQVLGVDIHIIQPPGPVPPVPIPHPFIGMVIDPMDYVPILGATVMVAGIPRAQAGTAGKNIPPHIPIGGTFIKPPGNECEVFMGSATVEVDGDAFTYLALPALSCQDVGMPPPPRAKKKSKTKSLVLPTSVVLAVPSGVFVGGPPTISLMAMGMKAGMAGAGRLFKKFKAIRKARKAKKKKAPAKKGKAKDNAPCGTDAHPVDVVTGACVDHIIDYNPPGEAAFRWIRWYDSSESERSGPMGRGFRHPYELSLEATPDGYRFTDETGLTAELPLFGPDGEPVAGNGYLLRRLGDDLLELLEPRRRFLRFRFVHANHPAVLVELHEGAGRLRLGRDREGRLLYAQDGAGRLYQIEHDAGGRVSAIHQRAAEPPHGVKHTILRFQYDAHGCLIAVTDAFGNSTSYEYENFRLTALRDRRGYRFEYHYDEHGRVVHTRGQDGLWEAWLEYVPEASMSAVRYADGGEWVKFYDANGMVTDQVYPDGGMLARRIDADGRIVEEIDPSGHPRAFLYDAFGAAEGRRDHLGRFIPPQWEAPELPDFDAPRPPRTAAEWEYGALLDPRNPRAGQIPERVLELVPAVARAALQLDGRAEIVAMPRVTIDAMGRTAEIEYADSSRERWRYDAEGNCIEYVDRDGAAYHRSYASWNLLATETDPTGATIRYEHSLRGLVRRFVDAGGTDTEYERDAQERIVGVRRHGAVRERYQWDQGNSLVEKRSTDGGVLIQVALAPNGLVAKRQLASGGTHEFAYDDAGRAVLAATDELKVTRAWDEHGRLVVDQRDGAGTERVFRREGLLEMTVLGQFRTRHLYHNGWDFEITDPTGGRHQVRLHPWGIIVRQLSSGRTEVAHFGEGGRCLGKFVSSDDSGWTRRFRHSPAGELREAHDDRHGITRYRYDAAHRLVASETAGRPEARIRYDTAGNITSMPGMPAASFAPGNRLAVVGADRFEYDARNHVAERRSAQRTLHYIYDSADMLVRIEARGIATAGNATDEEWRWSAAYDPFGRRAWKEWNGRRTDFFWDGDRLAAERRPDGSVRVYVYVDHAALVPFLLIDYAHEKADPATGRCGFIFTNQIGVPIRVEDRHGEALWSATIDPYGRAHIDPRAQLELNLRFPGHYFDPETGLHYNRYRYYSPELGRYLQSDPIGAAGGLNLYAYPANPLVHVDVLGLNSCSDPGGGTKGGGEGAPGSRSAKLGDDVDDIAKHAGMDPNHVKNLQQRASKGERIVVRNSNPASLPWQKQPYDGKPCVAKPVDCKLKTAHPDDVNAGLVTKKANPGEPEPPGYKYDKDGVLCKEPDGNAVHGDYDLQNVTKDGKKVDTNDPNYQKVLNDEVCPEHPQFQHGAQDDYIKDGKPGRYPEPGEKYTVFEPDGTAREINSPEALKDYYGQQKPPIPWPYG
jgi:RHS repeat-associated protein